MDMHFNAYTYTVRTVRVRRDRPDRLPSLGAAARPVSSIAVASPGKLSHSFAFSRN